jgi:hypothetical protein
MEKSLSKYIQPKRTALGFRGLESSRIVQDRVNQHLKRTVSDDARFELGRTQQNFTAKRFSKTVGGFIKSFGGFGLGNAKQLGRTTLGNLTIKYGPTVADCRKIEFSLTVMGGLFYETGRVVGAFTK